jgi:putative heme-binding domain-containing protein
MAHYFVIVQPRPLSPRATATTMDAALAALPSANPQRGEALFFLSAACASCHRMGNRGINFGPDLTNPGDRMEAKFIVQSMLDPGAVVTEGFSAHVVEAAGRSYFGMLLSSGKVLKLGLAGGESVELPADTITRHETLPVSPMPPQGGLLGPQDVADITAWLLSQKGQKAGAGIPGTVPAGAGFQFDLRADRLVIGHTGQPVAEFVFRDEKILRPYFANVYAPGGLKATRNHPPVAGADATDHDTMHPGIWLAFGDLSGADFWRNKGRIEHVRFSEAPAVRDGRLTFATECRLRTADGLTLCAMSNRFTVTALANDWLLVWDATFRSDDGEFTFGDQEEMGFGARVATAITEKSGGLITSSAGLKTAKHTWGQPAEWCDYSGTIDGRRVGITLVADLANLRPSWWHNRDYGVLVANLFGRAAMKQGDKSVVTVKRGEIFHVRFGAVIHSGDGYDPVAACRGFFTSAAPVEAASDRQELVQPESRK